MSYALTSRCTKVVCRRNRGKQPEQPSQPAEVLAGSSSDWVLQVQRHKSDMKGVGRQCCSVVQ